MKIRYIRDWLNGSNSNEYNHWNEIKALDTTGTNVAQNKAVTTNGTFTYGSSYPLSNVVDNNLDNYTWLDPKSGGVYVQVDLGNVIDVENIVVWHYYSNGRTYHNTKLEVSMNGTNWVTVFDSAIEGEYPETSQGRTTLLPQAYKLLAADELNYYTVVDGALKSILITEPLTAAQFMEHGSAAIPDTLLAPLYNARVLLWSQQPATLTATATATVPPQTLVTTIADMSNKTITGIQNVVCDVSGECLIAICWEGGESNNWEYFDGGEWQTATESRWGMTAAVLSAITTAQWTSYLATKSSRQYRFRFMMAQGDGLKSVKINYLNQ